MTAYADYDTFTTVMAAHKKRHLERKKQCFTSKIRVDNNHEILISRSFRPFKGVQYIWYVWYGCDNTEEDIMPQSCGSLIEARTLAFELSNELCEFCYDEEGNRRRN